MSQEQKNESIEQLPDEDVGKVTGGVWWDEENYEQKAVEDGRPHPTGLLCEACKKVQYYAASVKKVANITKYDDLKCYSCGQLRSGFDDIYG